MVGLAPELPYSQEKIPRNPLERDLAGPSGGLNTGVENVYTGCNRRNVRDFGRVFLMLNYTDITQNTYIQS
jgi:hypothetical protein